MKKRLINLYEKLYELCRLITLRTKYRLKIMGTQKTIKYILKHNCSIARYGDGEFNHIFNRRDEGYQTRSKELSEALTSVLEYKDKSLLICIPICMNTTKGCKDKSKEFWINWGKNGYQKEIVNFIREKSGRNYKFGDSQITRPYIDWKNNKRAKKTFPMIKKLWQDRNIIILEGSQTRLGVGNDSFLKCA